MKIGLVGLCTSHPQNWVPIIRTLAEEGLVEVEVVAAWDSGETRPEGFAHTFCRDHSIPEPVDQLEAMVDLVDAVIVHTTNWDRHVEQARPFVEAGKAVLIDKPLVGNRRDANQLLDWVKQGGRITGGSSLIYASEIRDYLAEPVEQRGQLQTAMGGCGTDEFNYGIHAYAMMCGLMGPGLRSVRLIGDGGQKLLRLRWEDGKLGILAVGKPVGGTGLPFHITAVSQKGVRQILVDSSHIYRDLLEACLPYLAGDRPDPAIPMDALLEPELTAIAARVSWQQGGAEVYLTDLSVADPGYDGAQFAAEYRRARLGG